MSTRMLSRLLLLLAVSCSGLAIVTFRDDWIHLPVPLRLCAYALALCALGLAYFGGRVVREPLRYDDTEFEPRSVDQVIDRFPYGGSVTY